MEISLIDNNDFKTNGKYSNYMQPHILISISNRKQDIRIPVSHHCKEILKLSFDDVEDISNDSNCFDMGIARELLNFVNRNLKQVNGILIHCTENASKSSAVACALSKILNHEDDLIFKKSIPNMLVYLTILECYFSEKDPESTWNSIAYIRERYLQSILPFDLFREWQYKIQQRVQDKGEI